MDRAAEPRFFIPWGERISAYFLAVHNFDIINWHIAWPLNDLSAYSPLPDPGRTGDIRSFWCFCWMGEFERDPAVQADKLVTFFIINKTPAFTLHLFVPPWSKLRPRHPWHLGSLQRDWNKKARVSDAAFCLCSDVDLRVEGGDIGVHIIPWHRYSDLLSGRKGHWQPGSTCQPCELELYMMVQEFFAQ